jgi:hypothetical protein
VKRNQIFDNRVSVCSTVAGLVATLPEGKKSDLLEPYGASGADGAFLSAVQKGGGKSDPILGVRLRPSKLVGYLDVRNPRSRHRRNPDTTYPATSLRRCRETMSFGVIEVGFPGLRALAGIRRGSHELTERRASSRAKRMRNGF